MMTQIDDNPVAATSLEKISSHDDLKPGLSASPLVSIIVRTKDRPKLLCEALKSIASQTYDTIEVVVVNDGGCSLDIEYLKKILGETPLVYVQNEHSLGRSGAGNIGLAHCRGQYFAFLDDDDALLPDHVQTLISFLENSDYKIAYSDVIEYQKTYDIETRSYKNEMIRTYSSAFDLWELLISNYIPFNALLFDVSVLDGLETLLDPTLEIYEDWDLLIRLALKYPFYHIEKVTASYYKWSDALQINNLSHFDRMRSHQKIVVGRYLSHLSAEYLIQLWQGHQQDTRAINQLKNEMLEKERIIENRQGIINDMEKALKSERLEHETLHQQFETKFADQEAIIENRQSIISDMEKRWETELTKHEAIVASRQSTINDMEVALDDEREQVSSLQKKLHAVHIEFEARVDEQARHIAHQQAVIHDMEASLESERNQVKLLQRSLQNAEAYDKREREKWQQKEGEYLRIVSQCKEEIRVALDEKNDIEQAYRQEREAFHVQENASQQQIQMANQEIHRLNEAVHLITISFAWRLVLKYRNLLGKIAPPGSMRWRVYQGARKRLGRLYRFLRGIKIPEPSDPVMELVSASASDIDLPRVAASMENGEPKSSLVPSSNRIILVSHDFEKAGAQINLLHIGKSLKAVYGKEVIFLALQNGAYREAFEAVGDEVMDLGLKLDNALEITPEIEKVFRDHKAQGVQFCLCNTVVCGVLAPLLDQLGYHFIHLIHELPILIDVCQFHQPIPAMKQHASMVVFSSEYARNTYIDRYGFERSKTLVRPQGSYFKGVPAHEKPVFRQILRDRLYLPRDAIVVLSCGYMSLRKAPDVFIALAGKIVSNPAHQHIHFVWLGGYELEVMNWVKSDVEKMGLTPNVHFVDFVDDPAPFFAGADIFVMPSREDPFPTVVLEAMDNGVPSIAFDNAGGIPELLTDGCGIIVPYLDVDAMQREILALLEDEKRYQTIVDKAKNRVRDAFDFDDYTGFLLELLEGMPTHDMDGGGHAERNEKGISSIETGRPNVANSVGSAVKNSRSYVRQVLASNRKAVGDTHVKFTRHDPVPSDIRMIAFYLPQFHPVPENDAWWGKGFTEWQNVSKAVPQFIGHDQPRLPGELGFYDLRLIDIQKRQVELAKNYGIQGFCYYYYWFSGRKILERPLEQMLAHPEINFPFCLCWANENWSRRWDGSEDDVLLEQHYYPEDAEAFISDIAEVLSDRRYIKINERPLLLVYRAELLPDPVRTTEIWRTFCRNNGIGEIYLCHIHSFEAVAPSTLGFDAAIEFPPNIFPVTPINDTMEIVNPDYSGTIYNYEELIEISCADNTLDYKKYRGITTGWDNEARKPGRGTTFVEATPQKYKMWLSYLAHFTESNFEGDEQLIFINAWNEWAEGTYLEPDKTHGYAYLEACHAVLEQFEKSKRALIHATRFQARKEADIAVIVHLFYFELWDEIQSYLHHIPESFDLYISLSNGVTRDQINCILEQYPNVHLYSFENRGRDIWPFMKIFREIEGFEYQCICKIHSKKSTHTDVGDRWRQNIFDALLGSAHRVRQIVDLFEKNSDVGILAPKGYLIRLNDCLGYNDELAEINMGYVHRFVDALQTQLLDEEVFVTGTMFWFRPLALEKMLTLTIASSEYPMEEGQIDGTIMHALERVITVCARVSGFQTLDTHALETCRKEAGCQAPAVV